MSNTKFNPICKPGQVTLGDGTLAIVTGWTDQKVIAKKLNRQDYAVIGQLYSPTRGISFLIRNLLANPLVRRIVVLNATEKDQNSGAAKCLLDFFENGVKEGLSDTGKRCWVIKSTVTGYIDAEIPGDDLESLRQSVIVQEASDVDSCIAQVKSIVESGVILSPWGNPKTYPENKIIPTVLPGNIYGHRIEGKTIAECWVKIIHRIKTTGIIRPTGYDGKWQELINLMTVITDEGEKLEDFYFPEPNYLPCDREFISKYLSQILENAPYQDGVKYTYGQRLRSWFGCDQVEQVIQKLTKEIDAASAVMNLWDVQDHEKGGSPCLNHIWVRVVDNKLSLTATFRSNDMFGAWPANVMGLRALQSHIKSQIVERSGHKNLDLGPLITISQSAHIYDDCWENADWLIKNKYQAICREESRKYSDPVGNFLIEVVDGEITIISQTTPGSGEIVACYSGKNPLNLLQKICNSTPGILPSHAGYLGMELQKASDCLKEGKVYIQDKK